MHSRLPRSTLAWCCGIAWLMSSYAIPSASASTDRKQLTAEAIATAVEEELAADAMVSLDAVRATVRKGTVRLEGSVSSLLAKDRATLIAETVKGVGRVDNALTVEPDRDLDPDELERRVRHAIFTEPATELFEINVTAIPPGIIAIQGAVDTLLEKEMAERAVRGVSGVTEVRNGLRVDYQAIRSDPEVAREIAALLRWDVYIDAGKVDVSVRNGIATLAGVVGSAAEKRRARSLALTAGLRDVKVDGLEVSRWARDPDLKDAFGSASDREVQEAVKRALRSFFVASSALAVDADDGVVTLSGRVPSLRAKLEAERTARSIASVHTVRNRLQVDGKATDLPPLTDNEIEQRIERSLLVSPLTEASRIEVDVRDGIATLRGSADTWYARGEAGDIAASIRGVNEVDNDLAVTNASERITFDPYVDSRFFYFQDGSDASLSRVRDAALEARVRDQLWWSPFVEESKIDVSAENGVVTLSGTVDNRAEREAAHENAFEGGANRVVDRLETSSAN